MRGHEDEFKRNIYNILVDIQNHGHHKTEYDLKHVEDAYEYREGNLFLSSNLFRNQVKGLSTMMNSGSLYFFEERDFSSTGAARTFGLNVEKCFHSFADHCCYMKNFPEELTTGWKE